MEGSRVAKLRVLLPLLPSSPALPPSVLPKQRTTATGGESSCSSCSVTSICVHEDELHLRYQPTPFEPSSHTK